MSKRATEAVQVMHEAACLLCDLFLARVAIKLCLLPRIDLDSVCKVTGMLEKHAVAGSVQCYGAHPR